MLSPERHHHHAREGEPRRWTQDQERWLRASHTDAKEDRHRGTRTTPEDTGSDTYRVETSHREMMQQELMDLGVWLIEHPEAAVSNLEPIRSARVLEPGVYYNMGTGMVERIFAPQHVPLGHRLFRISGDPAARVEEVRRKVMEGNG